MRLVLILSFFLAACGGGADTPPSTCGTSACVQAVLDAQQPRATIGTPDCASNPNQCH